MASNIKSISLGNNYTLQAYFNETGTNVEGNYSTVYVEAKLIARNTNWSSSYASYLRVYWHDNKENYDRLISEISMYGCNQWTDYYANGEITVYHNNDGNLSGYAYATFTKGSTSSYAPNSGSVATDLTALTSIPRFAKITNSIGDFNDEQTPWFDFSNPANSTMSCWLEVNPNGAHLCVRNLSGNSGRYTWELTESERNQLRAQMTTSNKGKIRIGLYSTIGGTTEASYVDKNFTIINAEPIFSDFDFEDINPTTLALTGDNSVNVNGYSNIKATITVSNKAVAVKESSMIKYQFRAGNSNPLDIAYSDSNDVYGTINGSTNGVYNVYAVDSRNNTKLVTKLASSEIAYQPVYIDKQSSNIVRNDNQVGNSAILILNGTFWNDDFGNVLNSITSVTYKFKKTDSTTWINGTTTITPTINNNDYTFTGMIASDNQDTTWDLESSYNIEVTISDELSSATIDFILNSATPTLSLDKEGVGVMCAYDTNLGGGLQVNGINIFDRINKEDIYIYATPDTESTSLPAGHINWTNLTVVSNNKITYSSSLSKYNDAYFNFEESGLYAIVVCTHWGPGATRNFCQLEIQNYNSYGSYYMRTTDTQNNGTSDPTTTNTFIVPIEAGSDMIIFLYSSSSGVTFKNDSYVQIYKIGEFNFN